MVQKFPILRVKESFKSLLDHRLWKYGKAFRLIQLPYFRKKVSQDRKQAVAGFRLQDLFRVMLDKHLSAPTSVTTAAGELGRRFGILHQEIGHAVSWNEDYGLESAS